MSGRPRFSPYADTEPQSTEVISTYAFDSHGKIYEHQVDQVIPPESMLVRTGFQAWLCGVCVGLGSRGVQAFVFMRLQALPCMQASISA